MKFVSLNKTKIIKKGRSQILKNFVLNNYKIAREKNIYLPGRSYILTQVNLDEQVILVFEKKVFHIYQKFSVFNV